jgi:diacylglycerol kinase (ATP)
VPAILILNPYAGRWKAASRRADAEAALRSAGVTFEGVQTEAPLHAIQIAEQAARSGYSPIIAAGGDGTISEVVNGLFAAQAGMPLGPLGILPLGTANDLAHNLGLPIRLPEAARAIAQGATRRIDLGKVDDWLFCNNSAVGLEPLVTIYNMRMLHFRGVARYLIAALRAIHSRPQWQMRLRWQEGGYEGPTSLVSVGNCAVTGGLFRMAPAADPQDGLLTFVFGYAPSRTKMLSLLPRAITGSYVNDSAVHQFHTARLTIHSVPATAVQADGEIHAYDCQRVIYSILPGALDILA